RTRSARIFARKPSSSRKGRAKASATGCDSGWARPGALQWRRRPSIFRTTRSRRIGASSRGARRWPIAFARWRGRLLKRSRPRGVLPSLPPAKVPEAVAPTAAGRWYAPGDWNAFFGLALDNLTQLVILSSLLIGVFGFPPDLVLRVMVPGTAIGVLVGD